MIPTVQEVLDLYEQNGRQEAAAKTSLQKQEVSAQLTSQLQNVTWDVEFADVDTLDNCFFVLYGKVRLPRSSWWRGTTSLELRFSASLSPEASNRKSLRERLLALKPGQIVRLQGNLTCIYRPTQHLSAFSMSSAELVD